MKTKDKNLTQPPKPFHKVNKFYLGGFKAFKDTQAVPIRPITLVFGPNSSGKSSLLKGLLYALDTDNNSAFEIGNSDDILNKFSDKSIIGFDFNTKSLNPGFWEQGSIIENLENLANFAYSYTQAINNPSNYQIFESSISIKLSAIPYGHDLKLMHLEHRSNDLISAEYSIFAGNMPLYFEIADNQINRFDSEYKDLLVNFIVEKFKDAGITETVCKFFASCVSEEIENLNVYFDPRSGRVLISNFGNNTTWYNKCLNESSNLDLDGISKKLKSKIQRFNDPNYLNDGWRSWHFETYPKYTKSYIDDVVSTYRHYINMRESPFSTNGNPKASKNIIDEFVSPKASKKNIDEFVSMQSFSLSGINSEFNIHRNDIIGFNLVYDAVLAIISDTNARYSDSFCSLRTVQSPTIKYISAARSFLDHNGKPTSVWNNLIINPSNRLKVNQWLTRLTEHFQVTEPSKMYTESQALLLQKGLAKIGDGNLTPIIDNELRITDTRIPSTSFRPQDVGFGIQKLVPVVAASVYENPILSDELQVDSNETIDIVAIEEPEMHLHPKLQSDLGDLFVDNVINNSERIFLIETHSEHLLLRILKRIRDGQLSSDSVSVLYVHPGNKDSGAYVEHLKLDNTGDFIKPWPQGFFDVRRDNLF
jgi:AAA15 family ATPase/GTPase